MRNDMRVLVLAPTPKDFALTRSAFEHQDVTVVGCDGIEQLHAELERGAGALLVAEEALAQRHALVRWIENQPAWSDIPVLVLARPSTDSARSEERRVGKECVSTCRSRGSLYP